MKAGHHKPSAKVKGYLTRMHAVNITHMDTS